MTDAHSKSRQQAEIAYGNVQEQFFAKDQAVAELPSIPQHRDDKTMRLREARSARELGRQPAQRKIVYHQRISLALYRFASFAR